VTAAPTGLPSALLAQWLAAGFNALVSLALMIFLARQLGAPAFGEFVAILGVATWGLVAIEGGWPTLLYRQSVGDAPGGGSARDVRRRATGHVLASGVIASLAVAAFWPGLGAALACMTVVGLSNLLSAGLRGGGHFAQEAAFQAAGRAVSALAVVVVVAWIASPGVHSVFLAWGAGLALVLATRSDALVRPIWSGAGAMAVALPFLAIELAAIILFKSDVALLRLAGVSGAELSGYAACTRFNEAALLLAAPVANVLLRELRLCAAVDARFNALLGRWIAAAALAGAACWGAALAFSGPLILLVFGTGYQGAIELLPWTAAALAVALPNLLMAPALIARGREKSLLLIQATGALALIVALLLGYRWAGARGAAAGVAAVHGCLLVAAVAMARRASPGIAR